VRGRRAPRGGAGPSCCQAASTRVSEVLARKDASYQANAAFAEFYEGKLGLPVVRTDADGSKVYASGGAESLVVYPSPDHAGQSTATLVTWYVDYGTDEKGISARAGGGKVAWLKDPDGNTFSIEGDR